MGSIIDFSKYLSKEDFISKGRANISSFVLKEIENLNHAIHDLLKVSEHIEKTTNLFYVLSICIQRFIILYTTELKLNAQLKVKILKLIKKIKYLNIYQSNLTSNVLQSIFQYLVEHVILEPTSRLLHKVMTFKTYVYLGLIKDLEGQGRLSIEKIRDLNTYSVLMVEYKKPKVRIKLLEQYFQKNRKVLLENLVRPENKIKHIHYDFEILNYFTTTQLIFNLIDRDIDQFINQNIEHEIF